MFLSRSNTVLFSAYEIKLRTREYVYCIDVIAVDDEIYLLGLERFDRLWGEIIQVKINKKTRKLILPY